MNFIKSLVKIIRFRLLRLRVFFCPKLPECESTLIIAPHPDDEVLGCGGLIARLVNKKISPHIIIMTGGEGSHYGCCTTPHEDIIRARRQLTFQATQILGLPASHIHCLDYVDGEISLKNTVETDKLRRLLDELSYDTVFVPHKGEGWSDHLQTAEIVKNIVQKDVELYEYCVWVWYYNVWNLDWCNAKKLIMNDEEYAHKKKAVAQYVLPRASCGNPWSGKLPSIFLKANNQNRELYFKING
jgi:LmbE family N-acetylglucosaminyl deacetylase